MAREQGIDLNQVPGTGHFGTRDEARRRGLPHDRDARRACRAARAAPRRRPQPQAPAIEPDVFFGAGQETRVEAMSLMRKKIAEHMTMSKRTSAHVTTCVRDRHGERVAHS